MPVKHQKTKRIAVELYSAKDRNVGLGEFNFHLGKELAQRAPRLKELYGIEFTFIVSSNMKGAFGDDVHYVALGGFPKRQLLPFYPRRFDLYHSTHQYTRVKNLRLARNSLLTVHDINFIYERQGSKLRSSSRKFARRLRLADHLSFISQFARDDVKRHFPYTHPDTIIYNGVSDPRVSPEKKPDQKPIPSRFLLHLSSLQPKKNPHLLVEMMASLPEEHLVIVGNWNTDYGRGIMRRIETLGLSNVTALQHVSADEKAWLFRHCRAFLFPSLCEGFGLPPVEAMYCGKPVFLSTLTSLPEIGGPEAYYWSELEPKRMSEVVRTGLATFYNDEQTHSFKTTKWASQFNWTKCADEYVAYYLRILRLNAPYESGSIG